MTQTLDIVILEDNPHVLALLQRCVEGSARVQSYRSSAEALQHVLTHKPDLLIADLSASPVDGTHLLHAVRANDSTSKLPTVVIGTKNALNDKRNTAAVEDVIEKPFFLGDAARQIRRAMERVALAKATSEGSNTNLCGLLEQMSAIDLFQTMEMGRKSGALTFTRDGQKCIVYFADGQAVHAQSGAIRGDEAVYQVLGWSNGNFAIDFQQTSIDVTVTRSTQGLLMEGLRLLDEANRDASIA